MDELVAFFDRLPEGDRTFFKEPVHGAETVRRWLAEPVPGRFVARLDGQVVGYVALLPGVGWSNHVVELRLVVDPERRGEGLGRRLATDALQAALDDGYRKVMVEVVAAQESTIALFQSLGFTPEALLEDHVRDANGDLADLILLSHHVGANWETLAALGMEAPLD